MPDTPLNSDALEVALRSVCSHMFEGELAEKLSDNVREGMRQHFATVVSAYLAAALPEVTSAPELDALPYGSLVRTADGREFYKEPRYEYPWSQGRDGDRCSSLYLIHWGPVTVIHRPEVNDA